MTYASNILQKNKQYTNLYKEVRLSTPLKPTFNTKNACIA